MSPIGKDFILFTAMFPVVTIEIAFFRINLCNHNERKNCLTPFLFLSMIVSVPIIYGIPNIDQKDNKIIIVGSIQPATKFIELFFLNRYRKSTLKYFFLKTYVCLSKSKLVFQGYSFSKAL